MSSNCQNRRDLKLSLLYLDRVENATKNTVLCTRYFKGREADSPQLDKCASTGPISNMV